MQAERELLASQTVLEACPSLQQLSVSICGEAWLAAAIMHSDNPPSAFEECSSEALPRQYQMYANQGMERIP